MARGYPGAFGRKLNAPYVWIPLCVLFLAAVPRLPAAVQAAASRPAGAARVRRLALLLQPRRDRRVGAARLSGAPVPARARAVRGVPAAAADRRRSCRTRRSTLLVVGARVPDRLPDRPERRRLERDRRGLRGRDRRGPDRRRARSCTATASRPTSSAATPTGRSPTSLYVPFEQALPLERALGRPARRARRGDRVRPAGAAAACCCSGRRLRAGPGRHGARASRSGTRGSRTRTRPSRWSRTRTTRWSRSRALGRCWPRRSRASAPRRAGRRSAIALGAAAKFVTAALAPLFARRSPRGLRRHALLLVRGARGGPVHPGRRPARALRPDDRLPGEPPVAVQHLGPGRLARLAPGRRQGRRAVGLALARGVPYPRNPSLRQTAALGAAILIAVELTATHWFYLYVVWFVPFVFVALFAGHATTLPERPEPREREREAVFA